MRRVNSRAVADIPYEFREIADRRLMTIFRVPERASYR